MVSLNKTCVLSEEAALKLPLLPVWVTGKTGAMSKASHIVPAYIEGVAATVDTVVDWSMRRGSPLDVVTQSEALGGGTLAGNRPGTRRDEREKVDMLRCTILVSVSRAPTGTLAAAQLAPR